MLKTRLSLLGTAIGLLVLVTVVSFMARHLGWYGGYWFTDVILHTISGAMFALFWLGLTYKEKYNSKLIFILTLAMAGTFGSYFWEVWEYAGTYFVPQTAEAYIPELGDSLGDIACGLLGAAVTALIYRPKERGH